MPLFASHRRLHRCVLNLNAKKQKALISYYTRLSGAVFCLPSYSAVQSNKSDSSIYLRAPLRRFALPSRIYLSGLSHFILRRGSPPP